MGTLNAIYVRATDRPKVALFLSKYPSAFTEPDLEYYAIELEATNFKAPIIELQALSAELSTDVLWLSFQSVVDAFEFHHWRSGTHLRALVYGCHEERTWERAKGTPEAWEREAFFDPDSLKYVIDDSSRDEADELRHFWSRAEVTAGQNFPTVDARESARAVAEFYRLPGWS